MVVVVVVDLIAMGFRKRPSLVSWFGSQRFIHRASAIGMDDELVQRRACSSANTFSELPETFTACCIRDCRSASATPCMAETN